MKNNRIILICVALLLASGSATVASAQTNAQKKALRTAESETFRTSQFSVLAVKMNGDTIACINPAVKLVPASNMKLITTGIALLKLGKDFRFETRIGYTGSITNGTLDGDLYIIGGGDPTTGAETECAESTASLFGKWAAILKKAGIRKIDGRIIADPRYFKISGAESNGWEYGDIGTYFGAGSCGLNFFENSQNFYITPAATVGEKTFAKIRYPETPWMTIVNSSSTSKANTKNTLYYVNTGFGPYGEIRGCFPISGKGCVLECDNEFGAFTCAYYFYKYLNSNGINVTGKFADISSAGFIRTNLHYSEFGTPAAKPDDIKVIGSTWSAPLFEIVNDANKKSDNFFAETLMHIVGRKFEGSSEYDSCYVAFDKALAQMGLRQGSSCKIVDGSGLSRTNYVSPEFFVSFLRAMTKTSVFNEYINSLACPTDKKSTVSGALNNYPEALRERVHCKSGSMTGVRCYSGYITASDNDPEHTIIFSVMANDFTAGSSTVSAMLLNLIGSIAEEN